MPSPQDTANRKYGSYSGEMDYNYQIASSQRDKTSFRAHKVALNNDQYNPARLDNAIQQKLIDN